MKIKEQLAHKKSGEMITLHPRDGVDKAIQVMGENNIGAIVIVNEEDQVRGILTERDLLKRVLFPKKDPQEMKIEQIMTEDIHVANENDELLDWIYTMSHERFRHLPIVDEYHRLVGVLSQGDFVAYTWPDLYEKVKADIRGRVGPLFQVLLVLFAAITLLFIYLKI